MLTNSTTKAQRAEILLGDIPLEVFMLPAGGYKLSQTQVAQAVDKDHIYIRRFLASKSLQALPDKAYTEDKLAIVKDHEGRGGTKINAIPIELATAFWTKEAIGGNIKAILLLGACAAEAIERRADNAFGKKVSEEERNQKLKARVFGKVTRRKLTDEIKDYIESHPELSDNAKKFMYSNVSDILNLALFGRKARHLAEDLKVDPKDLRDALSYRELSHVDNVEDLAVRLMDSTDMTPIEAIKESCRRLLFPTQYRGEQ